MNMPLRRHQFVQEGEELGVHLETNTFYIVVEEYDSVAQVLNEFLIAVDVVFADG